jgi:O-antigen/teichoic acid export membrane protein
VNVDNAVKTVSKNMVVNLVGSVWQLLLVLIGTPLVLHRLGADSFGILALVGGTTGYFLYLEIGIGETVVKKVSENRSPEHLSPLVSTLFFFSAGFGLFLALLTALFALFGVDAVFSFAPPLMKSAVRVFLVIAAGVWFIYPFNVFSKVFIGLNRLDIYNVQRIVFQTLILAMMLGLLAISNTAESAVAAITLGGIFWKISSFVLLRRIYPQIKISPSLFEKKLLPELLRYKSYATISQLSGHMVYQCDIFMIGILLNPAKVTLYTVANTIAMKVAEASGVLITAVFPVLSSFHGAGMFDQMRKNFLFTTKVMAIGFLPVTAILFAYAEQILTLWVGTEYAEAAPALRWLSVVWYVNSVSAVSTLTVKAANKPEIEARTTAAIAISNLLLDYLLIKKLGWMGAVYATALTQFVGVIVLMALVSREVGVGTFRLHARLVVAMVLGALCGTVYLIPLSPWALPVAFFAYCAVFFPACYRLVLDTDERFYFKNIVGIVAKGAMKFLGRGE